MIFIKKGTCFVSIKMSCCDFYTYRILKENKSEHYKTKTKELKNKRKTGAQIYSLRRTNKPESKIKIQ
jgi:hypothetical protein